MPVFRSSDLIPYKTSVLDPAGMLSEVAWEDEMCGGGGTGGGSGGVGPGSVKRRKQRARSEDQGEPPPPPNEPTEEEGGTLDALTVRDKLRETCRRSGHRRNGPGLQARCT